MDTKLRVFTFLEPFNLQYHLAHHLNERNFVCNECPQAYNTSSDLAQHRRIHEKHQQPFSCPECGLQFQYLSQFNVHLRTHRKNIVHECTICNKTFTRSKGLAVHMRDIHQEIDCGECGETFGKRSEFDRHVQAVHRKLGKTAETVACDICGEAVEKSKHQQHLKAVHSAVKEHKCEICCRVFKMPSYLKSHHDAVHLGIKNHECNECDQKFAKMSGLKRHKARVHLKGKDFKCDLKGCGQEFPNKFRLRLHMMNVHLKETRRNEEKKFFCDCCADGNGYVRKSRLVRHLQRKLPKKFEKKPNETSETVVKIEHDKGLKIENDEGFNGDNNDEALNDDNDWDAGSVASCSKNEPLSDDEDWKFGHQEVLQPEIKEEKPMSELIVVKKELLEAEVESKLFFEEKAVLKLKCNLCSKTSDDENSLKCHLINAHDLSKLKCTLCEQTFENKDGFKTHFLAVHAYTPNDTADPSKPKTVASRNPKGASKPPQKKPEGAAGKNESASCEICGKSFWNRKYLSTHISGVHRQGEKAFECEVCLTKFTYKKTRDRHFKSQHSGDQT